MFKTTFVLVINVRLNPGNSAQDLKLEQKCLV